MTNTQLTLITKAVDPNPTLAFLKNVLVRPAHDHITLTAINMTKSWGMISVTIPCLTTRKENYAIAIGDLKHHIKAKSCDPFAPITPISAEDTAELIKCLGEGASATEFPPTAAEYPAQAMLDAEYAISKDESRYVLNGTLLDETGNIVSTNGRCLYVSEGHKPVNDKPLIVPDSKLMRAFHRTAAKNENNFIQVTEKNGETYLRLRTYGNGVNAAYVTKAVAGNYPNWRQVMPNRKNITVQFNPQHVIEALDSLPFHLGSDKKTKQFIFRVRKGVSQIVMQVPGATGEDNEVIFAREHARNVFCISNGTMDISFNADYLRPALEAGFNTMHGIDDISPGLFTKMDDPHNARFVLMPIRTAQPEQAKAA
jgi:DNA polymerase III sliding clamp (beta) subunit (PCNA family)